jgi:hypothetical protein
MHRLGIAGFLVVLCVSGCASTKGTSTSLGPRVAPAAAPPDSTPQSIPQPASTPPRKAESSTDGDQSSTPAKTPDAAPPPPPPPVSPAARPSPAKGKSSGDARPVKQAGAAVTQTRPPNSSPSPAPASPPSSPSSSAPAPTSASIESPTLNLADLEQRLRETRAIGVFTKLSLKNQVDDLLNAFRALYRGPNKHPPAELRQRYDLLLLKVLTLLQDGDPPLAAAISSSREAIWSILADPDKFAKI